MTKVQHILSLDIGLRRTGAAYADTDTAVPVPLPTIAHTSFDQLRDTVMVLLQDRSITTIVIGLPLLPSGDEGEQASIVRSVVSAMQLPASLTVVYQDERYTTPREVVPDDNASAACEILLSHLRKENG